MDASQIIIAYVIVTLGAVCQSSIGMGFGLVTAPILLMLNPAFVPITIMLASLMLSPLIIRRDRTAINFSGIGLALVGRLFGALIAAAILVFLPKSMFPIIIGSMLLLGVMLSLLKTSWNPTPPSLFGAGILSGIMGTLAGTGGPPMGLLYQHQKGPAVRGTLAGFLGVGAVISLLSLLLVGKCTFHELRLFLLIVPAILLGFVLSRFTIHNLDKGYTRMAILAVSALSGIVVIIKSLMTGM